MIQILPVSNDLREVKDSSFFKGQEHFYTMEMQDGNTVMGKGSVFIKGEVAYLLSLEVMDQSILYMAFDSILRSLLNLASHHGAKLFNANEIYPLMGYFTKNEFEKLDNFTLLEEEKAFKYYVAIEPFFAKPCKG